jgi:hypothetical protein
MTPVPLLACWFLVLQNPPLECLSSHSWDCSDESGNPDGCFERRVLSRAHSRPSLYCVCLTFGLLPGNLPISYAQKKKEIIHLKYSDFGLN